MIVTINITEEQKEVLEDFLIKAQEQKLLPQILWGVDGEYNKVHILSDNATNGDMIKAIFNPCQIIKYTSDVQAYFSERYYQFFGMSWWNAPYKGVEE